MYKKILLLSSFFTLQGYEYPKPIQGYYSQKGQDKYLNEQIFKDKTNGTFVEIGAHDGISFSNTYFFESNLGWTGLCVEPNPDMFEKLTKNRSSICEHVAISNQQSRAFFLKCTGYILEMYSGLINVMDSRHMDRILHEMEKYGGTAELILVTCTPLDTLFQKHNLTHIDFMSLDIEGGEEAALQSIDFSNVTIDIILVENNFNEQKVQNFLATKGYKHIQHLGKDDIYQRIEAQF